MDPTTNHKQGSQRVVRHAEYYIHGGDIIFLVRGSIMNIESTPKRQRTDRWKTLYSEYIAISSRGTLGFSVTSFPTRRPLERSQKALRITNHWFSRIHFQSILSAFSGCFIIREFTVSKLHLS